MCRCVALCRTNFCIVTHAARNVITCRSSISFRSCFNVRSSLVIRPHSGIDPSKSTTSSLVVANQHTPRKLPIFHPPSLPRHTVTITLAYNRHAGFRKNTNYSPSKCDINKKKKQWIAIILKVNIQSVILLCGN